MNKNLLYVLGAVLFISACSKDDGGGTPAPAPPAEIPQIGAPSGTYTKKALLEYHTASWCSACPDAEVKKRQVEANFPGRVIPVAVHQSDAMQIPLFMTLDATFGSNPTYGMVNRVPSLGFVLLNRTQWMSNVTSQLNQPAKCGLAINSVVSGNTATIEVQAAFREEVFGNVNLTVYVIESDISGTGSGYDQANSYNNDQSSPYYNQGNPIVGFKHEHVARKTITANLGDPIESSKLVAGGLMKKQFTADLTGFDKSKTFIVAFVNIQGNSATTHEVLNVQRAKAGVLQDWD